jgi:hypothetical protein
VITVGILTFGAAAVHILGFATVVTAAIVTLILIRIAYMEGLGSVAKVTNII